MRSEALRDLCVAGEPRPKEMQMKTDRRTTLAAIALAGLLAGCPTAPVTPVTLAGYAVVSGAAATVAANSAVTVGASCAAGSVALGGGVSVATDTAAVVRSSAPLASGGGWTVTVANTRLLGGSLSI